MSESVDANGADKPSTSAEPAEQTPAKSPAPTPAKLGAQIPPGGSTEASTERPPEPDPEPDAEPGVPAKSAAVPEPLHAPEDSDVSSEAQAVRAPEREATPPTGPTAETVEREETVLTGSKPTAEADESSDPTPAEATDLAVTAQSEATVVALPEPQASESDPPAAEAKTEVTAPKIPAAVLPLIEAQKTQARVKGKVIGWNKGGFHVVVDGVPAFCPKSQIEIGNPKRASAYLDRELEFRILEVKENGKRIVASRREILTEDRKQLLDRLAQLRSSGAPVDGTVVSITDFGAFVDVGGLEGLVHLSQLSRKRTDNPRDVVQVGQPVKVRVLKIEKGGERISLSIKALEPDPWKTVDDRFAVGGPFTGKVMRRTDFGLFVELDDGIEGLLHSSQVALGKTLDDYQDGAEVEGWIREVDGEKRRLSLSLREVSTTDPWTDIQNRYSEGDEISGTVEQIAKFGIFVILEPGLTGLLPMSALSLPAGANVRRMFQAGQEIRVLIDSLDRKKRRISLAPAGAKLEGTRADYRNYQRQQTEASSMNAMQAAFTKLRQP